MNDRDATMDAGAERLLMGIRLALTPAALFDLLDGKCVTDEELDQFWLKVYAAAGVWD